MKRNHIKGFLPLATAFVIMLPNINYAATTDNYNFFTEKIVTLLTTLGITAPQQSSITAYIDRDKLDISGDIANYRTYYSEGEKLNIIVEFTGKIKSCSDDTQLVIKFGDNGTESVLEPLMFDDSVNGQNYLKFEYYLKSGDNGTLILTNLEGIVYDDEDDSIEIALPNNGSPLYQNDIIADTIPLNIAIENDTIHTRGKMYVREKESSVSNKQVIQNFDTSKIKLISSKSGKTTAKFLTDNQVEETYNKNTYTGVYVENPQNVTIGSKNYVGYFNYEINENQPLICKDTDEKYYYLDSDGISMFEVTDFIETDESQKLFFDLTAIEENTWTQERVGTTSYVKNGTQTIEVGTKINGYEAEGVSDWYVLGAQDGKLLITTDSNVTDKLLYGQEGYEDGIETLNSAVSSYADSTYADSVRSINVEDINRVTGYNPEATGDGTEGAYGSEQVYEYGNNVTYTLNSSDYTVHYTGTKQATGDNASSYLYFTYWDGSSWKILSSGESSSELTSNYYNYYPDSLTESSGGTVNGISTDSNAYKLIFKDGMGNDDASYWLGSQYIGCNEGYATFGLRGVYNGQVKYYMCLCISNGSTAGGPIGVRPVVELKDDIFLKETNGEYSVLASNDIQNYIDGNYENIEVNNYYYKLNLTSDDVIDGDEICIPGVCDLAGNKTQLHLRVNVDGTNNVTYTITNISQNPVIDVTSDGNLDEDTGITYSKEGKTYTILTTVSDEEGNVQVKFGEGEYKDATYLSTENGLTKWEYTVEEGDNGVLTVSLLECMCGAIIDTNSTEENIQSEKEFTDFISDTTAPSIADSNVKVKKTSGNGAYALSLASQNTSNLSSSYVSVANNNMYVWTAKNSILNLSLTVDDDNLMIKELPENQVLMSEESNAHFTYENIKTESKASTDGKSFEYVAKLTATAEGVASPKLVISDFAGNEITYVVNSETGAGKLLLLNDFTEPNVSVEDNITMTNEDSFKYSILVTDSGKDDHYGSGVFDDGYDDVQIVNGKCYIIEKSEIINNEEHTKARKYTYTIIPESDGYVKIYIPNNTFCDNVYNYYNEKYFIEKVYVDTKGPVIEDITGIPTNWTKETTVSVVTSDEGVGIADENAYCFTGTAVDTTEENWTNSNNVKVSKNGTLKIQVKDKLENLSETEVIIDKIDNNLPTISDVTQTGISSTETQLTINATDDESGIAEYSFDGGTNWQTTPTKSYSEATTVEASKIQVKDNVGNIKTYEGEDIEVEMMLPNQPVINDVTGVPTNWVKDATISVIVSDEGCDLAEDAYCYTGTAVDTTEENWTNSNSVKVTKNGTLIIKVKDIFDRTNEKTISIDKIDDILPTISDVTQTGVSSTETQLTINATDDESGIAEYSFDGGTNWQTTPTKSYSEATTVEASKIQVKDNVGNIKTYEGENIEVAMITSRKPILKTSQLSSKYTIPTGGNKSSIDFEIEADADNACKFYYAISSEFYESDIGSKNLEFTEINGLNKVKANLSLGKGKWYVYFYAIDKVSGENSGYYYFKNAIEIVESSITLTADITNPTFDNVVVSVNYGDTLTENRYAGLNDARESGIASVTLTENGIVYAEATDKAGNKVYASLPITNIYTEETLFDMESSNTVINKVVKLNGEKYIIVQPDVTKEKILSFMTLNETAVIKNSDETTEITSGSEKIKSYYKLSFSNMANNKYTILVKGDLNGDGQINMLDIIKLNKARLGKTNITDAEELIADVTGDGLLNMSDILRLNKYRIGKISKM